VNCAWRTTQSSTCYCYYRLKKLTPAAQLFQPRNYDCPVMPCIDYYNPSLAGLPASTLAPVPLVQISAAKLILDWSLTILHRLCATKSSLATIHIMFKVATVMHSIFLCSPLYLSKLFAYCTDEPRWYCLQSLSTRSIIVCWRRTQFGRCSFSVLC